MNTYRKLMLVVSAVALTFVLAIAPAAATESHDETGDDGGKITLPETPRDQVGLIVLGLTGLAGLAALANAAKQLRGERDQATGEYRWR